MEAYDGVGAVQAVWEPVVPLKARPGMESLDTAAVAAPTVPEKRVARPRFAVEGERSFVIFKREGGMVLRGVSYILHWVPQLRCRALLRRTLERAFRCHSALMSLGKS